MADGDVGGEAVNGSASSSHSKAFGNLVREPKDVVGLLAYALLKQTVAENAARGYSSEQALRDPGEVTCGNYRNLAEQMLTNFATSVVEDAREEIQQSAVLNRLSEVEANVRGGQVALISHVSDRTSVGSGLVTSVVGWLITVGITVLILVGTAMSGWGDAFLDGLRESVKRPSVERTTPPATPDSRP